MTTALRRASAIVVGAGGLGSAAATHLVGAGIGQLGVVDSEPVTAESLRRAPLQWTSDAGASRAGSAASKLGLMTPDALVEPYPVRLEPVNAAAIVAGADLVVDCSGTEETRDLVVRACVQEGVPLVTGGVAWLAARVVATRPGETACWRCVHPPGLARTPAPDHHSREGGATGTHRHGAFEGTSADAATGPVTGIAASIQVLQGLGLLTPRQDRLGGDGGAPAADLDAALTFDGASLSIRRAAVSRRAGCPACAEGAGRPQSD